MITPPTKGYSNGFPNPYLNKKYRLISDIKDANEIDDLTSGGDSIDEDMEQFFGTEVTITYASEMDMNIKEDNEEFEWNTMWLEGFHDKNFKKRPVPKIKPGDKVRLISNQAHAMYMALSCNIDMEFDDEDWTKYYGKLVTIRRVFKENNESCFEIEGHDSDDDYFFMARAIERSHNVKIDKDGNLV